MAAQAECNISSSIQNIDYGKRSAAMRQVDRGKTTQLADRTITLVMQCDQDAHIRVQLNTANISNNGFGFGPNGSLNLIASDAFSGSNNLDLALASGKMTIRAAQEQHQLVLPPIIGWCLCKMVKKW